MFQKLQIFFEHADIRDRKALDTIFEKHQPDAVMHLAAESHVDRSIDGPADFIETNVNGTFNMLEAARSYWQAHGKPETFRFHHISTDEVFGSLPMIRPFSSRKKHPMIQEAHTQPQKRALITWCVPGTKPMACLLF